MLILTVNGDKPKSVELPEISDTKESEGDKNTLEDEYMKKYGNAGSGKKHHEKEESESKSNFDDYKNYKKKSGGSKYGRQKYGGNRRYGGRGGYRKYGYDKPYGRRQYGHYEPEYKVKKLWVYFSYFIPNLQFLNAGRSKLDF